MALSWNFFASSCRTGGCRAAAVDLDAGLEVIDAVGVGEHPAHHAGRLRRRVRRVDRQGIVEQAVEAFGRLDLVVNAAATDGPARSEDLPLPDWERVLAVNLTAPFAIARAAMPHLRRAGGGLIVNVSSVAGRRGWANAAAYCATKFALTGLTPRCTKPVGHEIHRRDADHHGLGGAAL
jgi:NAD(P)-dependent dehydrogenase (short-subunit alcohol dehydrogenase family)